ncbi:hypothetical protein protein [Bacillus cereus G9241]|nr:hypothetical protein protein [Bacillus cereus G9241]
MERTNSNIVITYGLSFLCQFLIPHFLKQIKTSKDYFMGKH